MEGPLSDQWADVRLFGSGYRSRHYHPRIPNRQTRRHRIARGNAQHRSGAKFQICLASMLETASIWLHALPVGWMAVVVFGATYLTALVIHAVVSTLATFGWVHSLKAVSPGM